MIAVEELDLTEEMRQEAKIRNVAIQLKAAQKYNSKVRPRILAEEDLVLCLRQGPRKNSREGKLAANWEGPYRIRKAFDNRAFKLETLDQKEIQRTWNSSHLKFYYN